MLFSDRTPSPLLSLFDRINKLTLLITKFHQNEKVQLNYTMLESELNSIILSTHWIPLGSGSYNHTYISKNEFIMDGYSGYWVHKIPYHFSKRSTPLRALQKWSLINPDYPAFITDYGWICPYFGDIPASDSQIANKIIEIYQKTGNIITDACSKKNFLNHQGKIICIDMDHSFRRGSLISEQYYRNNQSHLENYLSDCVNQYPETVLTIRVLLYLDQYVSAAESTINYDQITPRLINIIKNPYKHSYPLSLGVLQTYIHILNTDPNENYPTYILTATFVEKLWHLSQTETLTYTLIQNEILLALKNSNLFTVIKNGDLPKLQYWLQNNQVTPTSEAIVWAIKHEHEPIVHYLMDIKTPEPPYFIHQAAEYGLYSVVKRLITINPDRIFSTNSKNNTPLFLAIVYHHTNLVELLYRENLPIKQEYYDHTQLSYLDVAIINGAIDIIPLLMNKGLKTTFPHDEFNFQSIFDLIEQNYLAAIKILLQFNPNLIAARNHEKYSPLEIAVLLNQQDIAVYLIEMGAFIPIPDKKQTKKHLIHWAAQLGQLKTIQKLLELSPSLIEITSPMNQTPLFWAISNCQTHVATCLIEKNANIYATANVASENIDSNTCQTMTTLDCAMLSGHTEIALFLLQQNVKAHLSHNTIAHNTLFELIKQGDIAAMQCLLTINPILKDVPNTQNMQPLELALRFTDPSTENTLRSFHACVSKPYPQTNHAIHFAASNDLLYMVEKLLHYQPCLIHATNEQGQTALHIAARNGNKELCEFLLKNNADPFIKSYSFKTPEDIWHNYYPERKNIFNIYSREYKLYQIKTQINQLLANKISYLTILSYIICSASQTKNQLLDLQQHILQTAFHHPTHGTILLTKNQEAPNNTPEDETAPQIIRAQINQWINDQQLKHSSHQTRYWKTFFNAHSVINTQQTIEEIIKMTQIY